MEDVGQGCKSRGVYVCGGGVGRQEQGRRVLDGVYFQA